jgi:hypothetical protein
VSQNETRRVPPDWSVAALHAAGAECVAEAREDGVLVGYDVAPPVSDDDYTAAAVATAKAELGVHLRARRWLVENGGVLVNGVPIATDDRSKTMLIGSRLAAMAAPESFSTPWSALDGSTHQFNAAQMIAASDAALAHVQACFQTQGILQAAIDAGTITTTQEIDAADWPATVT